ncbi:nucleotide pyrophosphohydrolase [Corynebacterium lubricantis]|uniref:nucleotide pyrophosphohydrolase n=1 Tax=Corynebacterium lubricantis TaxID=541095 RepID=UPI0003816681|nr:nucleotide pyrophosphohydrolase [Corynebacterium lubricantis]
MQQDSVIEALREFSIERNWGQFHTPANLAKSISIEAAELLECFQWDDEGRIDKARLELADVLTYAYYLADSLGESPEALIKEKLEITRQKYPVEKSFGSSTKYDEL